MNSDSTPVPAVDEESAAVGSVYSRVSLCRNNSEPPLGLTFVARTAHGANLERRCHCQNDVSGASGAARHRAIRRRISRNGLRKMATSASWNLAWCDSVSSTHPFSPAHRKTTAFRNGTAVEPMICHE